MDAGLLPDIETIRFEGLSFAHEGRDATLKNCDFEFPAGGRALWVKSPEGAGKSTLLQLLAGLVIPQQGSYLLNGQNVVEMSFEEFLPYRLRIGFTFDYGGLINNRTIMDNLLLPLVYHKLLPVEEARARVAEVIARFDLAKFAGERPAHVPGRVRKIAVLLRGLVIRPQVLLLDDPSVGLGEGAQQEFVNYLRELRSEHGLRHLIVSSYDERFMALMDHDIIHLDGGLLYLQPGAEGRKVVGL